MRYLLDVNALIALAQGADGIRGAEVNAPQSPPKE
jgi:hypothetical protein